MNEHERLDNVNVAQLLAEQRLPRVEVLEMSRGLLAQATTLHGQDATPEAEYCRHAAAHALDLALTLHANPSDNTPDEFASWFASYSAASNAVMMLAEGREGKR